MRNPSVDQLDAFSSVAIFEHLELMLPSILLMKLWPPELNATTTCNSKYSFFLLKEKYFWLLIKIFKNQNLHFQTCSSSSINSLERIKMTIDAASSDWITGQRFEHSCAVSLLYAYILRRILWFHYRTIMGEMWVDYIICLHPIWFSDLKTSTPCQTHLPAMLWIIPSPQFPL